MPTSELPQTPVPALKPHICPFRRCGSSYMRKGKLREHLIKQNTIHDEAHPETDPLWEKVKQDGFLKVYTRPKNLTEEERHARKKANGVRCWAKNRDAYLNQQREARKNVKKALETAAQLTTIHKAKSEQVRALQTNTGDSTVVATLYFNPPQLISWLGQDISVQTFPRFVAYFYPPEAWPVIEITPVDDDFDKHPFMAALPGKKHYKAISKRIHPDKTKARQPAQIGSQAVGPIPSDEDNDDDSPLPANYINRQHANDAECTSSRQIPAWAQATLNAGWALWSPLIEDEELISCDLFDAETEKDFSKISDKHASLVELYWEWTAVIIEAKEMLIPKKLSLFDVEQSFVRKKVTSATIDPNEAKLWEELQLLSPPRPRKRKRSPEIIEEESEELEDDYEEVEEQEEEDLYGDGTNPVNVIRRSTRLTLSKKSIV